MQTTSSKWCLLLWLQDWKLLEDKWCVCKHTHERIAVQGIQTRSFFTLIRTHNCIHLFLKGVWIKRNQSMLGIKSDRFIGFYRHVINSYFMFICLYVLCVLCYLIQSLVESKQAYVVGRLKQGITFSFPVLDLICWFTLMYNVEKLRDKEYAVWKQ